MEKVNTSTSIRQSALSVCLGGALAALGATLIILGAGCKSLGRDGHGEVELALSIPKETNLAIQGIPAAQAVWIEMIDGAKKTIDFGEFYAANQAGEGLEPVIQAVERAGARGVQVRFVFEKNMVVNDPATYERLGKMKNVQVRIYDIHKIVGGIIHAKFFVVDKEQIFVGSQNFDWRALDQIHETGVRVKDETVAQQLTDIFEIDWKICETGQLPTPPAPVPAQPARDIELVASPAILNPAGVRPAIEALLELLNNAKKSIKIQVMSYSAGKNRAWAELDDAMRSAAARGVKVQLLVSNWTMGGDGATQLQSLSQVPNLEVRFTTIPEATTGCIPFARLVHSKFVVVDDDKLWVSTSNWSKGYFYDSRNVDLIFRRKELNAQGQAIFESLWTSAFAAKVDPAQVYTAPVRDCSGKAWVEKHE